MFCLFVCLFIFVCLFSLFSLIRFFRFYRLYRLFVCSFVSFVLLVLSILLGLFVLFYACFLCFILCQLLINLLFCLQERRELAPFQHLLLSPEELSSRGIKTKDHEMWRFRSYKNSTNSIPISSLSGAVVPHFAETEPVCACQWEKWTISAVQGSNQMFRSA